MAAVGIIRRVLNLLSFEDWHVVGAVGEPAFENDCESTGDPFEPFAFRLDPFGNVVFKGAVTTLDTGAEPVFTLPIVLDKNGNQLYRPAKAAAYLVPATEADLEGGNPSYILVIIKPDGTVTIPEGVASPAPTVFDGLVIRYVR